MFLYYVGMKNENTNPKKSLFISKQIRDLNDIEQELLQDLKDKINLIKNIPNSDNFLLIGAVRDNGFYIITHFETEVLQGNELKSLLGRGDLISKDTRPGS